MMPLQDHYTYDQKATINELGLRSRPVKAKRPGEVRILAVGDSMVYGQGVADGDTIPARLEARLSSQGQPVTVVNAGHRGYATNEELALVEELHERIEPDVVVLYWYWNDVLESDIEAIFWWLTRTGPVPFDTGRRPEGLERLRWHARQLLRHSATVVYANEVVQALRYEYPSEAEVDAAFARLGNHLQHLQELARQGRFRVLVAVVPEASSLDRDSTSIAWGERVKAIAERLGLPTLDLRAAVEAAYRSTGRLPIVPYDGHYTAPANEAMAVATASRLVELGWWPHEASPEPGPESRASTQTQTATVTQLRAR